jgi:two-component sensor histidine kinase
MSTDLTANSQVSAESSTALKSAGVFSHLKKHLEIHPIHPFSFWAFLLALGCFLAASALRFAFLSLGATSALFSTYFPAILITALIAGSPAALLLTTISMIAVWWDLFRSGQLGFGQQLDILSFLLSGGIVILLAHWNRKYLERLHRYGKERELIQGELEHRGRNTHAVISAIVQKTLENEPEMAEKINGRIRAIKYANDLINHSSTHTLPLKSLLLYEFTGYGENRFDARGENLELPADTVRQLALVFHEMVTNAAKYGALTQPNGRVLISWKRSGSDSVTIDWKEEGGGPASPPQSSGFGTKLITYTLKSLGGSITPNFDEHGFRCTMTFRLNR